MKSKLSNSKNEDLKSDIRPSNLDQFTAGLVALMNAQDSIKIKDGELSNIFLKLTAYRNEYRDFREYEWGDADIRLTGEKCYIGLD